jgi:hypothetical protein
MMDFSVQSSFKNVDKFALSADYRQCQAIEHISSLSLSMSTGNPALPSVAATGGGRGLSYRPVFFVL